MISIVPFRLSVRRESRPIFMHKAGLDLPGTKRHGDTPCVQVSMNGMMEMIGRFDGKQLPIRHIPGPEGVRGRNSDNARILEKLGWEPTIKLNDGLKLTYDWIKVQLSKASFYLLACI